MALPEIRFFNGQSFSHVDVESGPIAANHQIFTGNSCVAIYQMSDLQTQKAILENMFAYRYEALKFPFLGATLDANGLNQLIGTSGASAAIGTDPGAHYTGILSNWLRPGVDGQEATHACIIIDLTDEKKLDFYTRDRLKRIIPSLGTLPEISGLETRVVLLLNSESSWVFRNSLAALQASLPSASDPSSTA